MPDKKQLTATIEKFAKALAQSFADTQYWHGLALESINQTERQDTSEIQSTYKNSVESATQIYNKDLNRIRSDAARLEAGYHLAELGWETPVWRDYQPRVDAPLPRFTRFGMLTTRNGFDQIQIPALLPIIEGQNVLIHTNSAGKERAQLAVQAILLRLLAALPPGKLRFTFIDPVGLGQSIAPFMHLADYDDMLITGKAWTESQHISQQLANLTEHMENVIQKYLRNQYATIEDYNTQAGEVAEPYRLLVVMDFPANFNEESARRLTSIARNGPRCGVYTLIVANNAQTALRGGFNYGELSAHVIDGQNGQFVWKTQDFEKCVLEMDSPPEPAVFNKIVESIGAAAQDNKRVEVPFTRVFEIFDQQRKRFLKDYAGFHETILTADQSTWWKTSAIPNLVGLLGPSGAKKVQCLDFGKGTTHHALVAGRVGSGKTTLLHTLITSLSMAYSPEELELYLIDFKQGVAFKIYALCQLPHARVIAIESEREFGLSVLQGLEEKLQQRGELLRKTTERLGSKVETLAEYRDLTGQPLPRILLIVDEFQVLFAEDDKINDQAKRLLETIIRQGRYVGIHVLLSTQTLSGTARLPDSIVGQMGVRIALQCGESDSRLILADDNPAARLLSRPGEGIYNSANGLVQGNSSFQVAWLPEDERERYLQKIHELAQTRNYTPAHPPIIFEGNTPADIKRNSTLYDLFSAENWPNLGRASPQAWLGEPIAIKPHLSASFRKQSRSNLLIIGQNEELAFNMLTSALLSLCAQYTPEQARFVVVNLPKSDEPWSEALPLLAEVMPHDIKIIKRNKLPAILAELAQSVAQRTEAENYSGQRIYLVMAGLRRIVPDLRGNRPGQSSELAQQLLSIWRGGPEVGVHNLVWTDAASSLTEVAPPLPHVAIREFDLRVGLQMSAEESSHLIDGTRASQLGPNRAYFYDEEQIDKLQKFRPYCALPEDDLRAFGKQLSTRHSKQPKKE